MDADSNQPATAQQERVSIEAALAQLDSAFLLLRSGTPEEAVRFLIENNLRECAHQGL